MALLRWRRPPQPGPSHPEHFGSALRAGGRYVRYSPVVRRLLARVLLFVLPGSVVWGLLPLVARQELGLGATGYGVLLAALGVGAIAGALLMPRVRAALLAQPADPAGRRWSTGWRWSWWRWCRHRAW